MPVSPGCPASAGCCLLLKIAGSRGAPMTNVIVYSFKGYDTARHRHILRPAKATLERIRRIDDAAAATHEARIGLGVQSLSKVPNWGFGGLAGPILLISLTPIFRACPSMLVSKKPIEINRDILKTAFLTSNARPGRTLPRRDLKPTIRHRT